MIKIEINNNTCMLSGKRQETNKLYAAFKIRNPNAFHIRKFMPRGWDGKFDFIKDTGKFDTGLLDRVLEKAKDLEIEVKLDDNRPMKVLRKAKIRTKFSDGKVLREYQLEAVQSIFNHKIQDILHPRGMLKVATNGGKTIISAGLYKAYKKPTIFVMNSRELFRDALRDIPAMLGSKVKVGYIGNGNGKIVHGDFMICMVKSLQNKSKDKWVKEFLAQCQVGLWDECDMAGSKTNKAVVKLLYNCIVRVGLSGTLNATNLKKDILKHWGIEALFGKEIHAITNRKLIDLGVSSEVQVKFLRGNEEVIPGLSFAEEYDQLIIKNKKRNRKIIKRIKYHLSMGRDHQLIILQRHEHIDRVFKMLTKADLGVTIDWVHHTRKDRYKVVDRFKDGKTNILIGSMILKRGKNFPLMNYMMNAGAGKSPENILQLLGRAFRGSNKFEDFWDLGKYLKPHSRKRDIYYRNEKLEVINNYKTLNKETTQLKLNLK